MATAPLDLIADLNAPEVVFEDDFMSIVRSRGDEGTLFEFLPKEGATLAHLAGILKYLPPSARIRDAFNDQGEICINFWMDAA